MHKLIVGPKYTGAQTLTLLVLRSSQGILFIIEVRSLVILIEGQNEACNGKEDYNCIFHEHVHYEVELPFSRDNVEFGQVIITGG